MRYPISFCVINLLFADLVIVHASRLSPGFKPWAGVMLFSVGIFFLLLAVLPNFYRRYRLLAVLFPALFLLAINKGVFHFFYQAPLLSLDNFRWLLLTLTPEIIAISLTVLLVNAIGLKGRQAPVGNAVKDLSLFKR